MMPLPPFTETDFQKVLEHYPFIESTLTENFGTSGTSEVNALSMSMFAQGQQQRANNLYAELTFDCPAYWMADGFC